MENQSVFINEVLPVLASFIASEDGNMRMLCLKLLTDISTFFLDSESDDLTSRKDKSKSSLLKVKKTKICVTSISFSHVNCQKIALKKIIPLQNNTPAFIFPAIR